MKLSDLPQPEQQKIISETTTGRMWKLLKDIGYKDKPANPRELPATIIYNAWRFEVKDGKL